MTTIALIGDSIRLGYEPYVREALGTGYEFVELRENGYTSANVLAHLEEWCIAPQPQVIHLNCGLHDLKREFGSSTTAVPLDAYAANLERIMARLRAETDARLIWATTTPVNYERHHANKPFDRLEEDVRAYNAAALEVVTRHGAAVNDLYALVMREGRDRLLLQDGVHFSPEGYALLGEAVGEAVR